MSDNLGIFDCAVISSSSDNFIPKESQNEYREQESMELVTANIYESRSNSRRRVLSETMTHKTSRCVPYLITFRLSDPSKFDLNMTLEESSAFPSCDFWNISDSHWDTAGCFVHNITNDSVVCGCTHLTTFKVSGTEMIPEANVLPYVDRRELTLSNLWQHPVVWVTCVFVGVVFFVLCLINPRAHIVHARSILGMFCLSVHAPNCPLKSFLVQ